ncbi:DUF6057 family protein [Bacteroidota bacterium]
MKKLGEKLLVVYPYIFAFLYFIILMFIETSSLYAFQNKSFLTTREYFSPFLEYSGGLFDYLGLFFSEMLKFNFPGALLYALITLASILLYKNLLIRTGVNKNLLLISAYPFIFIFSLTFNHFHPLSMNLKMLFTLSVLYIILGFSSKRTAYQILSTIFFVILWYLCGLEFFIIAFVYLLIHTTINKVLLKNTAAFIISAIIILLLNTYVYYTPLVQTLSRVNEYGSQLPRVLFFAYVMFMLVPITAIIKLNISINEILQILIIIVIGYLIGLRSFSRVNHTISKFLDAGNKNEYSKILHMRKQTEINTRIISAYTNLALINKRNLLDQMFIYNQGAGKDGLFPSREFDNFNAYSNMKLCFNLGLSNQTVRWAMEATTYFGFNAEILKHLILAHLVNDEIKVAEKYNLMLENTIFNNKQKKNIGKILADYKNGTLDRLIIEKKRLKPKEDFFTGNRNDQEIFSWASKANNNPKAFECYIAACLLENDFEDVKKVILNFRALGYKRLPIHVQEALCLFYAEGQEPPDLHGFQIDQNIMQDCAWFFHTISRYSENLQLAHDELVQRTGNTYWFYLYYISPVTRARNE